MVRFGWVGRFRPFVASTEMSPRVSCLRKTGESDDDDQGQQLFHDLALSPFSTSLLASGTRSFLRFLVARGHPQAGDGAGAAAQKTQGPADDRPAAALAALGGPAPRGLRSRLFLQPAGHDARHDPDGWKRASAATKATKTATAGRGPGRNGRRSGRPRRPALHQQQIGRPEAAQPSPFLPIAPPAPGGRGCRGESRPPAEDAQGGATEQRSQHGARLPPAAWEAAPAAPAALAAGGDAIAAITASVNASPGRLTASFSPSSSSRTRAAAPRARDSRCWTASSEKPSRSPTCRAERPSR